MSQTEPFDRAIDEFQVRKAIHVGGASFKSPELVYISLIPDFMSTAIHWTEKLLDSGLRIMYYSGNLDFIVAYPLSENAYKHMKWKGFEKYRTTKREPFIVNSTLAGFVQPKRFLF